MAPLLSTFLVASNLPVPPHRDFADLVKSQILQALDDYAQIVDIVELAVKRGAGKAILYL